MKISFEVRQSLTRVLLSAILGLVCPASSFAQVTWTGNALDGQWTTATNWDSNNVPVGTDDIVFGATTGTTNITWANNGIDQLNSLTFNASAPSYTVSKNFSDLAPGSAKQIINNSPNLQTLNTGVAAATFVSAAGPITINPNTSGGTNYFYGQNNVWLTKDITLNTKLANSANKNVYGPNGPATVVSDMTGVTGKFILNTDTGTANSNSTTNFTGQAHVWSGTLDVRSANALGRAANITFVHGTFVKSTASDAQLQGGYEHGFGALAVDNNISLAEAIRIDSRIGDAADFDQIVNISGANTITNLNTMGGGGHYNYDSLSGTLNYNTPANGHTIQITDGPRNDSAASDWVNSVFTFRGAGDINLSVNINKASGIGATNMVSVVRKDGGGTLTLSPAPTPNNDWDGGTLLDAGKIVVGTGANISTVGQTMYVAGGATLDVSANASGLTFADAGNNRLRGSGTVVGNVTVNGDTTNAGLQSRIQPGGVASLLSSPTTSLNDSITYAGGAGVLAITGNLTMSSGGQYDWGLENLSTALPGTNYDQVTVGGTLTLGGTSVFKLTTNTLSSADLPGGANNNVFWHASHAWLVIDQAGLNLTQFGSMLYFDGSVYVPGTPIPLDLAGDTGAFFLNLNNGDVQLNYVFTAAVPEPGTIMLAALGFVGLVALRRRHA